MSAFVPSMRWFGPRDAVPLDHIRQAGATGVVTALHHIPCGEAWPEDEIQRRIAECGARGLRWIVAESVPVHEDIKRATGDVARYLENYRVSLRNLGKLGVRTVCYNFMAVTDWTRTNLGFLRPEGTVALRFDMIDAAAFDLHLLMRPDAKDDYPDEVLEAAERRWAGLDAVERDELSRTILLGLPGTVKDLTPGEFCAMLDGYREIDAGRLRENHAAFLRAVVPTAEEAGVRLAIHPDDPPFPVFGLPRIAGTEADLRRLLDEVDSPANGLTFCSGSLGAHAANDLPGILDRLGDRVHFLHLRSVRREPDGSFFEDDHLAGSSDMVAIVRAAMALSKRRGEAIPMRPDHGHLMGDDLAKEGFYPGYAFVGRLKGLAELRGLEMGLASERGL